MRILKHHKCIYLFIFIFLFFFINFLKSLTAEDDQSRLDSDKLVITSRSSIARLTTFKPNTTIECDESFFCASELENSKKCRGNPDLGSPLIVVFNKKLTLYGIYHQDELAKLNKCSDHSKILITPIFNNMEFIREYIDEDDLCFSTDEEP